MKYPLKQGLRWYMLSMAVTASAQVSAPVASTQLPTGGKVMSGTTSIQSVGNVLNINQSSQRSAINWNTFNVGSGAKVNFIQPSASSVTLNRVLDTNGSQILGSINANGQVFISNPNGVLFGPNSQVNVGGLIATTQNISVDDFMAGKSTFEGTGAASSVVNQGTLEAALGGYIALLAPSVRNEGVVLAREGTVAFAAGDKTVVQFNGPQLVSVMVDRSVLDALVENKQIVRADGGLVIFSARSANAVLSSVIRNTGTVQTNTIVNRQGRIMLEGGSQGVVEVGGALQASGVDAGTQGGTISATGDKVSVVSGALLDATGQAGGGNVLVGGGWQGSDPTIQSANAVNIASGAVLNASAIQNGKGGTVVAWSDTQNSAGVTKVQGTLLAWGGALGGDGGRIETSGRWISVKEASGDARSPKGIAGQWLFDPYNVEIVSSTSTPTSTTTNNSDSISSGTWVASGANSTILNTEITSLLNAGTSVAISTTGTGTDAGNITVNAPVERTIGSGAVNLTLTAYTNIDINEAITVTGSGSKLELNAGNSSTNGSITLANTVKADTLSLNVTGSGNVTQSAAFETNNLRIYGASSNVTLENTSNKVGVLAANVGSLSLKNASGIDLGSIYGSGTYVGTVEGLSGVTSAGKIAISVESGNLFVEQNIAAASTSSDATSPALKLSAGASFSVGADSTNTYNPYGPNIILTSGKTLTIGSGGTGILYSGGFSDSGAQLATYLGANASRYNSNASTINYSTALGTGLTAIYRQNPTLTVTAPNSSITYGATPSIGSNTVSGYSNSDTVGLTITSAGSNTFTPSYSSSGLVKAGSYDITPSAASSSVGYGFTYTNGTLTVSPKSLSLTAGITAASKVYDGLTTATLSYSTPTYSGLQSGDSVSFSATGSFANKDVGTSKTVTISGASLSGTDASNYTFTNSQTSTTADITSRVLAVTAEINSADKVYDTTRTATPTLVSDKVSGDSITIAYSQGMFDTKNVGTGKTVTVGGITISGTDASNYTLQNTSTTTTSAISSKTVELSNVEVTSKTYDTTNTATISGGTITTGSSSSTDKKVYSSDTVSLNSSSASGVFADANVGTSKSVTVTGYALSGSDASNYSLTQPTGLTGSISQKAVSILGISADSKTYDSTTTATFSGTSLTSGASTSTDYKIYSSDASLVSLDTSGATGVFSNKNVANGISVSAGGFALSGANASNYSLSQPSGLTANITQAQATVTADSAITTYTGASQSVSSFTASGLVGSETTSVLTGISVTGSGKNAGSYSTVASGSDTNYAISFVNGSLLINKADATLTGLSASQAYDGYTYKLNGFTASGLVGGETTSDLPNVSSVASGRFSGTYLNTPKGSSDNYNLNFVSGKLVITGCANGPPCATIGPQILGTNVVSAATAITTVPSIINSAISTTNGVSDYAPVATFTSSSVSTSVNGNTRNSALSSDSSSKTSTPNTTAISTTSTTSNAITQAGSTGSTQTQITTSNTIATAPTNVTSTVPVITLQQTNTTNTQLLDQTYITNNAKALAATLTNSQIKSLSAEQIAPLLSTLSLRQLMSLSTEQLAKLESTRIVELLNTINELKNNSEKLNEKSYNSKDKAFSELTVSGLLNAEIDALSSRISRFNERNTAAIFDSPQKIAELLSSKKPNDVAAILPSNQITKLSPEQITPLLSDLSVRQLLSITNEQMSKIDPVSLNKLLNTLKELIDSPAKIAEKTYTAEDKLIAQLATTGSLKDPIERLSLRAAYIAKNKFKDPLDKELADLTNNQQQATASKRETPDLTPLQIAALDSKDLEPLIGQLNANQLMAITDAQMSRLEGSSLTQLSTLLSFVQQRISNPSAYSVTPTNFSNSANSNVNVMANQPVSKLAINTLLSDQPKPTAPRSLQPLTQTNITANLTPRQISELDPTQLAPLISQLNANQLLAITNTQMARLDTQSINQLNILMNFVQQRALNSNTTTTIYINQPVSRIAAASLMNDQPLPPQVAGTAPAPIATVPLSPQQIAGLTPSQVAPLLNRMNSRQLMAVTDTQMASLDSANLNQLITLLNFIQDSARTSPIVTNNFANRPVAGFLPPELNTTQTLTQP